MIGVRYFNFLSGVEKNFVEGVNRNYLDKVRNTLDNGFPIDFRSKKMVTPLHYAVTKNRATICQLLINKGCKINDYIYNEAPPIHCAIMCRSYSALDVLVRNNANIEIKYNGNTPLEKAVLAKDVEMVNILLKHGACVTNSFVLHKSCVCKTLDSIEIFNNILDKCTNFNSRNENGNRPIDVVDDALRDVSQYSDEEIGYILLSREILKEKELWYRRGGFVTMCMKANRENCLEKRVKISTRETIPFAVMSVAREQSISNIVMSFL